ARESRGEGPRSPARARPAAWRWARTPPPRRAAAVASLATGRAPRGRAGAPLPAMRAGPRPRRTGREGTPGTAGSQGRARVWRPAPGRRLPRNEGRGPRCGRPRSARRSRWSAPGRCQPLPQLRHRAVEARLERALGRLRDVGDLAELEMMVDFQDDDL